MFCRRKASLGTQQRLKSLAVLMINKVLYVEAPPLGQTHYPFITVYMPFLLEKVYLSYTFHWHSAKKTDNIVIERKDDILPWYKQILTVCLLSDNANYKQGRWKVLFDHFQFSISDFNCMFICFLKYLRNKSPIFKEKIFPKNAVFGPNSLPPPLWCPVQVFVRSNTMPQRVVKLKLLTTNKEWGKVLFDHFQFCSILSDICS